MYIIELLIMYKKNCHTVASKSKTIFNYFGKSGTIFNYFIYCWIDY